MEKSKAENIGQLAGLSDKVDLFGYFPGGDHVPFKEAGVPTITVVSGGAHPHFHQPSDTADTVNPEILQSVARYVLALTWQLANQPNSHTSRSAVLAGAREADMWTDSGYGMSSRIVD